MSVPPRNAHKNTKIEIDSYNISHCIHIAAHWIPIEFTLHIAYTLCLTFPRSSISVDFRLRILLSIRMLVQYRCIKAWKSGGNFGSSDILSDELNTYNDNTIKLKFTDKCWENQFHIFGMAVWLCVRARIWEDDKRRLKTKHRRPSTTTLVTIASYIYDRKEKFMLLATVSNVVVEGLACIYAFVGAKTNDCIQTGAHQHRRQHTSQPSKKKGVKKMRNGAERCRFSTVSMNVFVQCPHLILFSVTFRIRKWEWKRTMQKNQINRNVSD